MRNKFMGSRLKRRRIDLGFTLDQVAKKIGSSKSYVWEMENKQSDPSGSKVWLLAVHLGVPMSWFYGAGPMDLKASKIGALVMDALEEYLK